jgi:cytosine/adenosine deaminase-related metal-dependent hydrolase
MWQVMRGAIDVQMARGAYEPDLRPLHPSEAFYLATHGGARALGKAKVIGTLDIGKEADLTIVNLASMMPYPSQAETLGALSTEDVVALCVYRAGPHVIRETYVRGKCVYPVVRPGAIL